ncbi:unnamed protein product, partial [Adineta steineri]
MISAIKRSRDK